MFEYPGLLPSRTSLTALGTGVVVISPLTACVDALPTTIASQYIWNGEPAGGKSLIIDKISWVCTTTAGAQSIFRMMYCLGKAAVTQPATTDTLTTATINGKTYAGKIGMGHTATIANDGWVPVGPAFVTALTTTLAHGTEAEVNGGIIVPPGRLLSLACYRGGQVHNHALRSSHRKQIGLTLMSSCLDCRFYVSEQEVCRRYPQATQKFSSSWCGEFKPVHPEPKPPVVRRRRKARRKKTAKKTLLADDS